MRLGREALLQLLCLTHDAFIGFRPIACQVGHSCICSHILSTSREDTCLNHLDHCLHLNAQDGVVILIHYLLASIALLV